MTDTQTRQQQYLGYSVLAIAVIVAVAVGAFLFLSGGDDDGGSPEQAVRAMYDALNRHDEQAYTATLAPGVRDDPLAKQAIPFRNTFGAFDFDQPASVDDLKTTVLDNTSGWALIAATGKADIGGEQRDLSETIYVQQTAGQWFVSTEAAFVGLFQTPRATASSRSDLGPLDPERPEIGKPAPDFALLDVRDGTTVRKLSDYRGTPVVVNWYASWCQPCKDEIPDFQQALDALDGSFVVLGVDYGEDAKSAVKPLDDAGATYPAVLDSDQAVYKHYRGYGVPNTFFVDADGVLQWMKLGWVHPADLEEGLAAIGIEYTASDEEDDGD